MGARRPCGGPKRSRGQERGTGGAGGGKMRFGSFGVWQTGRPRREGDRNVFTGDRNVFTNCSSGGTRQNQARSCPWQESAGRWHALVEVLGGRLLPTRVDAHSVPWHWPRISREV